MAKKEDFLKLIAQSNLSQEDKELWEKVVPLMEEDQVAGMKDIIDQDETHLLFFTENLKSKKEALLKGDKDWQAWIDKKEEEYLDNLELA